MDNQTLTPREAAELARISPSTLSRLTKDNKIPHKRISPRIIRYQRAAIEAWLNEKPKEPKRG